MPGSNRKNLTQDELNHIVGDLIDASVVTADGRRLATRAVQEASKKFKVSVRTIWSVWKRSQQRRKETGSYHVTSLCKGNSGRPRLYDREELMEALEGLPCVSQIVQDL